ncbi:MAG: HD domain-containing phosphohydrolase [Pseudomonadota bacterium]
MTAHSDRRAFTAAGVGKLLPSEGEQFQTLIDAIPHFVMVIDERHRILRVNRTLCDTMGVDGATLLGHHCPKVIHGMDGPFPGCPLEASLHAGAIPLEREVHVEDHDRWYRSSVYPMQAHTADGAQLFLHVSEDITETKATAARNLRHLLEQATLGRLLRKAIVAASMPDMLQDILDELLALPWLAVQAKGSIFLARDDDALVMVAQTGLDDALLDTCKTVPFGTCLCGRAAATRETVFAGRIDERHDRHFPGMTEHGHYCVPILADEQLYGVINLYIAADHERIPGEQAFLEAIADAVAITLRVDEYQGQLEEQIVQLKHTSKGIAQSITRMLDVRDPYTAGHQDRVRRLCGLIAAELGLPEDTRAAIELAASLHDIGKIAVPVEILTKPTRLTGPEFDLIKTHSEIGQQILADISFPWPIADIVRQHHEKWDGTGYPDRLSGEAILLEARVLCVADVIEAIAADRPYRPALGLGIARQEVEKGRGTLFEPRIADAALRVLGETPDGGLSHLLAERSDD